MTLFEDNVNRIKSGDLDWENDYFSIALILVPADFKVDQPNPSSLREFMRDTGCKFRSQCAGLKGKRIVDGVLMANLTKLHTPRYEWANALIVFRQYEDLGDGDPIALIPVPPMETTGECHIGYETFPIGRIAHSARPMNY